MAVTNRTPSKVRIASLKQHRVLLSFLSLFFVASCLSLGCGDSEETSSGPKANLTIPEAMTVSDMWGMGYGLLGLDVNVELKPTKDMQPGKRYPVWLKYDGYMIGEKLISWNVGQPVQVVVFHVDVDSSAYVNVARGKSVKDVFDVEFGIPMS